MLDQRRGVVTLGCVLCWVVASSPTKMIAQPIPPSLQAAQDGTGTIASPRDNRWEITGGTPSGRNLFHSFQRFGLQTGERADFITAPIVQNVISRVVGGDRSVIDGQLKITGSTANLFLINPAGILFGPNASLNLPASFVASTADRVKFGDRFWSMTSSSQGLLGSPTALEFTGDRLTPITNLGNLQVSPDANLMLIAGNVDQSGQLAGGTIAIAALNGAQSIGITNLQDAALLTIRPNALMPVGFQPDGSIELVGGMIQATRNATLIAQNTVKIHDRVTPSGWQPAIVQTGQDLWIQGDRAVDLHALRHPMSGLATGGNLTIRSTGLINGDARYLVGGALKFETLQQQPAQVMSLNDPVILAAGDVTMGDYTGQSLHILAGGAVTIGTIEITGPGGIGTTINPSNGFNLNPTQTAVNLSVITRADGTPLLYGGTPELDAQGTVQWRSPRPLIIDGVDRSTLDIRAGIDWASFGGLANNITIPGIVPPPTLSPTPSSASITTGRIKMGRGEILITNQYRPNRSLPGGQISINTNPIAPDLPSIDFAGFGDFGQDNIRVVAIDSRGSVTIHPLGSNGLPDAVRTSSAIDSGGGVVDIRSVGNLISGSINTGAQSQAGESSVKLVSTEGNILVRSIIAGAHGMDIQAAGRFQVTGLALPVDSSQGTAGSLFTNLRTNPQLRAFVLSKLPVNRVLTEAELDEQWNIGTESGYPISLLARPIGSKTLNQLNAPIQIRHGKGDRVITNQFDVYASNNPSSVPRTIGIIRIQGDSAFNGGPSISKLLETPDSIVQKLFAPDRVEIVAPTNDINALNLLNLIFNQQFSALTLGSSNFTLNESGTIGAIMIGGGTNGELHGAIQSRVFPIVPPPPPPPPPPTELPTSDPTIASKTTSIGSACLNSPVLLAQALPPPNPPSNPTATDRNSGERACDRTLNPNDDQTEILKILNLNLEK